MQDCEKKPCYERSSILPIQKTLATTMKVLSNNQYDLKQNMFDPSKSSPPNDFMEKLRLRMSIYESFSKNGVILTNE
jgi:hypothetical protein